MSKSAILSFLCTSLCAAGATFNVVDFGARVTDCLVTTNIQAAIDACHQAGGGEVVVPEGVFRTGGLELKSGVTLRLLDGATLEGSADCADYAYAGETRPWYRGLLRADGANDIAVVGGRYSVIDGRNCFDPNGEESYRGPHAIRFTGCTNVTLKGYSVRDSANWAHALFRCANVKVERVRVYGGHDGFDAHASSNVVVSACEFHVGDDAIAGFGNECMTVRDTILDSACSAARFGGRNCLFERCRMVSPGSFGHRWKLSAEDKRRAVNHGETLRHSGSGFTYYCDFRWGDVPRPENIVFRDCTFDHPARFFSFSFDGRSQWCCNRPLASIAFENCEILGVRTLGRFYGGEEDPLSITLKNCRVTAAPGKQAQPVLSGYNFRKIRFENVSLEGFADPCVEKRSEGEVEIIGGTPVRVTYRKDPNDEVYTFEKAASLLAGMKADRKAFDGWMAENAARGEVWCRAYAAWRGASDAREEGEFFRRHYGYCFKGAKGVVASKRADGELSDVPFGAFVYALAQRSPIVGRVALTDFIRAPQHTPAAVAGAQEALRRLLLIGCGLAQGAKYDITVSAEGGVNTIAAAMEQARALRKSGAVKDRAVEVFVKAGRYRIGQPIRFVPEDSGIHFTGEGMRETVIDGGVELPAFRIGAKGVWETDVPQGLVFEQLYVNGRRAQLARHPSRHYLYMKDEVDAEPSYAFIARREDADYLAAIPADEREHVKLAFWQSWDMGYSSIKGIDTDSGRIDVHTKMGFPFFFWNKTCPRWAIYNCRAALDDPGEWYLDRKASKLFYVPRPGETIENAKAVAPVARGLVELAGDEAKNRPVRDVSFSHIGFEHQGFVMPAKGMSTVQAAILVRTAAIGAVCAEDVRFENCRVAHTGGHGIWLGGAVEGMVGASVNGVRRGLVRHCLVEDVGAGGVYLGSTTLKGKDAGPYSGKIELADSIIRNGGRFFHGAVAVWNGHVYENNIHHNDISDFFYTGISLGWLWGYRETVNRNNRIQFNRLHHLNQGVLSDMGAFYCLGDNDGSVVSDNWIHDVNGYLDNGSPAFGLYTDEGAHGVLLTRNLVERCRDGGINHHYGKENRYENNIFTDFHRYGVWRWRDENHVSIFLRNNIFWWKDPEAGVYHRGAAQKRGAIPGIVAVSNVYWCTDGKIRDDGFRDVSFGAWQAGGMDAGSVVADPLFVDPEHGDWTLRPESPALKLGFKPFDWTRAGVLKDDPDWVREAANATYAPFEDCPPAPKYIREKVVVDFEPCRPGKPVLTGGGFRPFRYLGNVKALKIVDTDVAQGRRALVITKLPGEKHLFQPHLEMRTPFPEGRIRIGFAFRADKGDNVHFEVREYAGGDSFTIGLTFVYSGGWISVNGQRVYALPHGKWADVEFLLDAPADRPGNFSVSVVPRGGTKVTKTFAAFKNGTFRVPNWFGFMTYGGDGTTWALDDFKIFSTKTDPAIENDSGASSPVAKVVMFKSPKSAVTNVVDMTPSAGGGWQCRIARDTVDAFRLDHIEVTSPLARARKGEPGYFVLGDGRYGTFRLDNGICGERPKSGFLPVAGMKTPRGAYMVAVRGLALESDFSVVATNGVYSLVTAFRLRGLAAKPGDHPYDDLVVEFLPMPEGKDSYADIARRYREEKLASGLVKPLSERVKGNSVLSNTVESIFVRVKHGWKALNTEKGKKERFEHQSPSNEPPIEVNIDFVQFKDIMRRMKEAGIDRAEVCSVGGTAGGFDGRFPDVLPIPEEFGGERGLKDAVAYGKSLGYQMTVHFATTAMLECSRRWNPDHLCLTPDGKPLARGIVAGGRTYRLCPHVYNSAYMAQDWKTFRDLGFLGTFHIDVISCIRPYACFNPLHPLNAAESAAHFRQVGDYSRKVFGAFGSEAGMDWMAPSLDFALYTSWYPGWGRRMESPLVDRLVPFWQLVYHGIVVSNPFYATIDAYIERKGRLYADNMITYNTFGDAETRILKLQEFGGRPVFYYTKYEDVAPLKRAYDDYKKRSHLQYCFMDDHRELAPDVFLTRYSNGEETVTNYGDKPFNYRNETVPPRTFKLFSR